MKTTGFRLSAAIEKHEIAKAAAEEAFKESLLIFEGEDRGAPQSWDALILAHDRAIATLQAAQGRLNALVVVGGMGEVSMTLAEAIKMLGVELRRSKRWREVAAPERGPRRWLVVRQDDAVRSKENVYAKPAVGRAEAGRLSADSLAKVQTLRSAIALGNATEIEIPVDSGLFD